jgi:superfamily II DNA or RNA helicase
MDPIAVTLALTPLGHLIAVDDTTAPPLDAELATRIRNAFHRGSGHGLFQLGAGEAGTALTPVFAWWRDFAGRYVTALCTHPDLEGGRAKPPSISPPSEDDRNWMMLSAPPMTGAEYLNAAVLESLWQSIDDAFADELAASRLTVQEFLKQRNPAWNVVGRVHFNLAEHKSDPESPFAFLATYTTKLAAHAKPQHVALGQALREYAGAANKQRLLSLLLPVQRASETCPWLKEMVDGGEIFHPLRWSPAEALRMLHDVPQLESAGVVVRMPASWRGNRPPRPRVAGIVGGKPASGLGQEALLDFQMQVSLEGEPLTGAEIQELLNATDGLALVRGRWVEIDRDQLARMIERFREVERTAAAQGLAFRDALRLLAGADADSDEATAAAAVDWSQVVAGPWLAQMLEGLRSPEHLAQVEPGDSLHGTLRPYQHIGLRWLHLLAKLGLGACLADDMGLGKTIQVLALLLVLRRQSGEPNILVAPASLIANWAAEIERFAPDLKTLIAHPSAMPAAELKRITSEQIRDTDLVITTYGSVRRLPWVAEQQWRAAILDEAQAIKNPGAQQTQSVKQLRARARIALTGTPIENRLGDLWSIFDFLNPGLLGNAKQFSLLTKQMAANPRTGYAPLRELVRPYILRRLKTDKSVISDLPDKTELQAFCGLSRKQAVLYEQSVKELAATLQDTTGIQRKGLVLSFLMRFKQICNHPSQWLSDGAWSEQDSGKFARLREIAETVGARQEKMLVFTQFRETCAPLASFLGSVFGTPGLVLHGETAVKKRQELVRRFQEEETERFFVLSLKAGGTGLNLTAASHVVHFDRWWNPAVENQATDRAFRIGQSKNVLVHKFVCRGTVEEKIDELIESKRKLAHSLLEGGADLLLTEMSNEELLKLVALDINKALEEQ